MINLKKLSLSFKYAFEGLWYAFVIDQNIRIHFLAAFLVIVLSIYFKISPFEMGILGVMILLVISAEMINASIEKMVDKIFALKNNSKGISWGVLLNMKVFS